jgi:hypothetical protein
MKGSRIPIPENGDIFAAVEEPGNYCGPVEFRSVTGESHRRVAFRLPNGENGVFHCKEPPHKFTEEPDGTLTITASILATWGNADGTHTWHGFLTKGVWVPA